jgi:streptogrisin C
MARRGAVRAITTVMVTAALGAAMATPAAAAPGLRARPASVSQQAIEVVLGASFAGAWLRPSTDRLAVATTDPGAVRRIRALGAVPRVVARTAAALDAVQSVLDARAATVPDSVTGWYVDPASNSVIVRATDVDAGQAFAAGVDGVRVEKVAHRPRPLAELVGGEAVYSPDGARCSIGFNATSGSTRYVITAGHCTETGGTWSGYDRSPVGPVTASSFPGDDFGLIRVESSAWEQGPWVSDGDADRITVTGSAEALVGASVCRSGSTTGYRCGSIEAKDQTVNYGGGDVVSGLTRTGACAEPGDSGGSYVSGSQAQGVLSGGSGSCLLGGETFFQPVNEVLAAYDLSLLTG